MSEELEEKNLYLSQEGLAHYDERIKAYIATAIVTAGHIRYEIVESTEDLPSGDEEAQEGVIYLVPKNEPGQADYYDEYMSINGKLELIGNTIVNMGEYYSKSEVDSIVSTSSTAAKTAAVTSANSYTDTKTAEAKSYAETVAGSATATANSYTNTKIGEAKTYAETLVNNAVDSFQPISNEEIDVLFDVMGEIGEEQDEES